MVLSRGHQHNIVPRARLLLLLSVEEFLKESTLSPRLRPIYLKNVLSNNDFLKNVVKHRKVLDLREIIL